MRIAKFLFSIVFGLTIFILVSNLIRAYNKPTDPNSPTATTITVCMAGCDYISIQEAINAANTGDTIYLSSETYTETITINKSITLLGNSAQNTILQAASATWGATTRVITITSEVSVTVQGLTIRNGKADFGNGGGIYNTGVLTLSKSIISHNLADFGSGGGIYNLGRLHISDTLIQNNDASMGSGGGIYNSSDHSVFDNVTFDRNYASVTGGGLLNATNDAILTNITFTQNSTGDYGGGGGLSNYNCNPQITNALFRSNSADYWEGGGAILNKGSNPIFTNIVIQGNSAEFTDGAGMLNVNSQPSLINVTINGNTTGLNGGGIYNQNSDISIINSILWDNSSQAFTGTATTSIFNQDSTPVISYSLIQGSGGSTAWDASLGVDGGNNLDVDPYFVSNYNDLHLQAGSPAIDAGNNNAVPADALDLDGDGDTGEPIPYDLGGDPRFFDVPARPNAGSGTPPIVDMGAYERQLGSAPTASDDTYTTPEDTELDVAAPGVVANDGDAESDPLAVMLDSGPSHGALTLNADGSLSYDPDPDYNGVDTFTYVASDTIFTATAAVTITVTPVNDAPTISDIPDQAGKQNAATGPIPFTVGDVDDPVAGLALSAETSDAAILPVGNVALGGAGVARTVVVTPLLEGTVVVTVTVSDGSDTAFDAFTLTVEKHAVYLPLVCNEYTVAPDLVVERIVATANDVQVVIANRGNAPVVDDFWVDAYVAPHTPPTAVNQTWDMMGSQGLVWGVTADLAPGEVLTLTVGGDHYVAAYSYVAWPLAPGTPVYAQVDSANAGTTYGAVLESHEITGDPYNNVTGPSMSADAGDGAGMPGIEPRSRLLWPADLPRRKRK